MPDKKYPAHTAGYSIVENVPKYPQNISVKEVQDDLKTNVKQYATVDYAYFQNSNGELAGVLSIKELLMLPGGVTAKDVMVTSPQYVHPYTDQEKAAYLALKHNLKAIPIKDKSNKLLGIIENDKLLSIMYRELNEDLFKKSGHFIAESYLDNESIVKTPLLKTLRHRIPWLITGFIGSLVMAGVISSFEKTLEKNIILASFIPLMVYLSNAVSQQVNAFVIRDLALQNDMPLGKYVFKHASVVFVIALILSSLLYLYGTVFVQNSGNITFILSIAVLATVSSSVITGLFVPLIFHKLKYDPADTSGPIGTIIQDLTSVFLYFTIASALI